MQAECKAKNKFIYFCYAEAQLILSKDNASRVQSQK